MEMELPPSPSIPRPSSLSYPEFAASYLLPNLPVILPSSITSNWACRSSWTPTAGGTFDHLKTALGSLPITPTSSTESSRDLPTTLLDLLLMWEENQGRDVYLKDWHLPLVLSRLGPEAVRRQLYEVPHMCQDDWMNGYWANWEGKRGNDRDDFRFVYMGGGDTFTPLHIDVYTSYSISTQIHGSKIWHLFPPSCQSDIAALLHAHSLVEDAGIDVRKWSRDEMERWAARGMLVVVQDVGETIFIPSGWYHQVTNETHPTISLNHNWCNAYTLPSMSTSMHLASLKIRASIDDVRIMLRNSGKSEMEWKTEWEVCVEELMERSEGWNWQTFWKMVHHALRTTQPSVPLSLSSTWPAPSPEFSPPVPFVVAQVTSVLEEFRARDQDVWKWVPGMESVLTLVELELRRLEELFVQ